MRLISPLRVLGLAFALAGLSLSALHAAHPTIYASDADRSAIQEKIQKEPWAAEVWRKLKEEIDPYVDRVEKDPEWATSRLAMYWKEGERYTQCYVKDGVWDRGEGNAPVPTVRLPGMRFWNDYMNVPLEDRAPRNETGDMLALSVNNPGAPPVVVPYQKSGQLIRANNVEILSLGEKAAFAYWLTGEEKYARFAAGIYWAWLFGTYYMNPPIDPDETSGGRGGYSAGGQMGFYDYEQIHDDLMLHAAPIYDFLYPYLEAHPHPRLAEMRRTLPELTGQVFKRFLDIGFVRGDKRGTRNVFGWNVMMPGILALEQNSFYHDWKGRDYYLPFYTTTSTPYHDALPEILKQYSLVTGLWPESPGYGLGTINVLLDLAIPIERAGEDTIGEYPLLQKAALAVFPWLDGRGNIVVFGDTRGGPGDFQVFERLLAYYRSKGDTANAALAAAAIRRGIESGQYDRSTVGWKGLCLNQPLGDEPGAEIPFARAAYSEVHRHVVMKNLNDQRNGLMFTLYGGYPDEQHLSPNGLALQLYGQGWALSPDASAYESYWSADRAYHQTATGSNTILPGYTAGPIVLLALEPTPARDSFTSTQAVSPGISFADVNAAEKRRVVAMIRTSPTSGYYVDFFRSRLPDNDYLFHNLGTSLQLRDAGGEALPQEPATLDPVPSDAYSYFKNPRRSVVDGDFQALWTLDVAPEPIHMAMWMLGVMGREVFQVDAPPSSIKSVVSPEGVSIAPRTTPTIIVRQTERDGWDSPFVAVFEPYAGDARTVSSVKGWKLDTTMASLIVESKPPGLEGGRRDVILNTVDDSMHRPDAETTFRGHLGVITEEAGELAELYLGHGRALRRGGYEIAAEVPVYAGFIRRGGKLSYSASDTIKLSLPMSAAPSRVAYEKDGAMVDAPTGVLADGRYTVELPAGYGVALQITPAGSDAAPAASPAKNDKGE